MKKPAQKTKTEVPAAVPAAYTIVISERQRKDILYALNLASKMALAGWTPMGFQDYERFGHALWEIADAFEKLPAEAVKDAKRGAKVQDLTE